MATRKMSTVRATTSSQIREYISLVLDSGELLFTTQVASFIPGGHGSDLSKNVRKDRKLVRKVGVCMLTHYQKQWDFCNMKFQEDKPRFERTRKESAMQSLLSVDYGPQRWCTVCGTRLEQTHEGEWIHPLSEGRWISEDKQFACPFNGAVMSKSHQKTKVGERRKPLNNTRAKALLEKRLGRIADLRKTEDCPETRTKAVQAVYDSRKASYNEWVKKNKDVLREIYNEYPEDSTIAEWCDIEEAREKARKRGEEERSRDALPILTNNRGEDIFEDGVQHTPVLETEMRTKLTNEELNLIGYCSWGLLRTPKKCKEKILASIGARPEIRRNLWDLVEYVQEIGWRHPATERWIKAKNNESFWKGRKEESSTERAAQLFLDSMK